MFASSLPVMIELSCARIVQRGLSLTEHNPWNVLLGGSPRIHAGDGALQRSGKSSVLITRFSAGDQKPGAKAHLKIATLFRWTKVQIPC